MTNVLFVTFYYAFIFPAGYFFAAATLAVHYWVDKFCLLRIWGPAPMLGSQIADMSRSYFFSFAIAVLAVMSSYNYASFPYDNACCKSLWCETFHEEIVYSFTYLSSFLSTIQWTNRQPLQTTLGLLKQSLLRAFLYKSKFPKAILHISTATKT
jgi:hypothetical protein